MERVEANINISGNTVTLRGGDCLVTVVDPSFLEPGSITIVVKVAPDDWWSEKPLGCLKNSLSTSISLRNALGDWVSDKPPDFLKSFLELDLLEFVMGLELSLLGAKFAEMEKFPTLAEPPEFLGADFAELGSFLAVNDAEL